MPAGAAVARDLCALRGFVMPDAYYTPKMGNVRQLTLSIGKNARLNRGAWWLGSDGGLLAGAVIFGASVMIVALDGRGLAGVAMRLCMHILSAGNSACVPCRLEALHAIPIGWRFRMQSLSAGNFACNPYRLEAVFGF